MIFILFVCVSIFCSATADIELEGLLDRNAYPESQYELKLPFGYLQCDDTTPTDTVIKEMERLDYYMNVPERDYEVLERGANEVVYKVLHNGCLVAVECSKLESENNFEITRDFEMLGRFKGDHVAVVYGMLRTSLSSNKCMIMGLYNGNIYGKLFKRQQFTVNERLQMSLNGLNVVERIHEDGKLAARLNLEKVLFNITAKDIVFAGLGEITDETETAIVSTSISGFEIVHDRAHDVFVFSNLILGLFGHTLEKPRKRYWQSREKSLHSVLFHERYSNEVKRQNLRFAYHFKPSKQPMDRLPPAVKRLVQDCRAYHPAARPWVPEVKERLTAIVNDQADPYVDDYVSPRAPNCPKLEEFLQQNPPSFRDLEIGLLQGQLGFFPGQVHTGRVYGCHVFIYSTLEILEDGHEFEEMTHLILRKVGKFSMNQYLKFLKRLIRKPANSKYDRTYTFALFQKSKRQ